MAGIIHRLHGTSTDAQPQQAPISNTESSMSKFSKAAPWISKVIVLLCTLLFLAISVQPLAHPAASAAEQGLAFTSSLGPTIFRVAFAGFPLGCAAFLLYCLLSNRRTLSGLIFSTLILGLVLAVRIYGMEIDASFEQSMPLIKAEIVLVAITLAGIALESGGRSSRRPQEPARSSDHNRGIA